jgi:protein-L-isoaspartate(D-aspartate) O-methyltransferase
MRFEDQRKLLVQELRQQGIRDEAVLAAFSKVPRELYVPPQYKDYAYRNRPLPIGLEQTISQPLMVAIMLEHLELKPEDLVLEIGTGSGYECALGKRQKNKKKRENERKKR